MTNKINDMATIVKQHTRKVRCLNLEMVQKVKRKNLAMVMRVD